VAYRLWIERGRPIGSPEENGFAAICQIKHNRTSRSVIWSRKLNRLAMHCNGRTRSTHRVVFWRPVRSPRAFIVRLILNPSLRTSSTDANS
jgi:hypothetical protein